MWPWNLIDYLEKKGHLFYGTSSFVRHFKAVGEFKLKLQSGSAQFGSKLAILLSCVTWKYDGWPWETIRHLFYATLTFVHHFKSHRWIQTKATVRKRSIWIKIDHFMSCVILKFDGWPWKRIGHLFYGTSSFVHHCKAIDEFKLRLQSGNGQFGSKSAIFCPVWPGNLMDDLEKQYGTSAMLLQVLCIISKP